MPPGDAHILFAHMITSAIPAVKPSGALFLASLAPDSFEPADPGVFRRRHFPGAGGAPDAELFLRAVEAELGVAGEDRRDLVLGYAAHLWLDAFFLQRDTEMYRPDAGALPPAEYRDRLHRSALRAARAAVTEAGAFCGYHPQPERVPAALAFVDWRRVASNLEQLCRASDEAAHSLNWAAFDEEAYLASLRRAAGEFDPFLRRILDRT